MPKPWAILFPEQNSTSKPEEFPNSRRTEKEASNKMTAQRCRARSSIRSSNLEKTKLEKCKMRILRRSVAALLEVYGSAILLLLLNQFTLSECKLMYQSN